MSDDRTLLRHTLATLAYRAAKAVRHAPPSFATFKVSPTSRTPVEILAHMGDLMDWGLSIARGAQTWNNATPRPWDQEVERFFSAVRAFDDQLAGSDPLGKPPEFLFQGPIADALQHTGQLTLLRRASGAAIRGENYSRAAIQAGVVGSDQPAPDPRNEFE